MSIVILFMVLVVAYFVSQNEKIPKKIRAAFQAAATVYVAVWILPLAISILVKVILIGIVVSIFFIAYKKFVR